MITGAMDQRARSIPHARQESGGRMLKGAHWSRRVGLALAGLAALLILAELLVRVSWRDGAPAGEPPPGPGDEAASHAMEGDLPVLRSVFELGRKNVRGIHKGLPFRTNSAGFRGPDVAKRPEPGVFRIVVAGDSVTMGSGVWEKQAYPALLEARLNERAEGIRYEVLNLGLSGINTKWVARRIETIGLPHHPHLIVYGYTMDDIDGPASISTVTKETARARRERLERFANSPSQLLRAGWPVAVELAEILLEPVGTREHDLYFNYFENPKAWGIVEHELDRMAALAEAAGICVHVLVHTGNDQLRRLFPHRRINRRIEQAARQRGFSVTQTYPYFRGRDPDALRLSPFNQHPNAAAHELLASALHDGLQALPERCWAAGPAWPGG
jgi:lysophospholipase L1-like esterase